MVAPYNHQSLQAEHGIKSVSTILTKHLTNYSLCEYVFGRKPKILLNLETSPDVKMSGSF